MEANFQRLFGTYLLKKHGVINQNNTVLIQPPGTQMSGAAFLSQMPRALWSWKIETIRFWLKLLPL